jgi:hypothetical protein
MVRRSLFGGDRACVAMLVVGAVLGAAGPLFGQAPSIDFRLDEVSPNTLLAGEPVTVRWAVVHARSVALRRPDGSTAAVDPYGWDTLRFADPGDKKFALLVVGLDGAAYEKPLTCTIHAGKYWAEPAIEFSVLNPYPQIGEEVRVTWHVSDARQVWLTDPDGSGRVVPLNGVKTVAFTNPGPKRFYLYVHDRTGRRFRRWVDLVVAERPR